MFPKGNCIGVSGCKSSEVDIEVQKGVVSKSPNFNIKKITISNRFELLICISNDGI